MMPAWVGDRLVLHRRIPNSIWVVSESAIPCQCRIYEEGPVRLASAHHAPNTDQAHHSTYVLTKSLRRSHLLKDTTDSPVVCFRGYL